MEDEKEKALTELFFAMARCQRAEVEPWRQLSDELNGRTARRFLSVDSDLSTLARYWWTFWAVAH